MWGKRPSSGLFRALAGGTVLALCAAWQGCALVPGGPQPSSKPIVSQPSAADTAKARQLSQALLERSKALISLHAGAVMEYASAEEHVKVREEIIARRPDDLRIEVMSPLGVGMVVASSRARLAIFVPRDNTLLVGQASAATLDRFARIPMEPAAAVALVMGILPESEELSAPPQWVRVEGSMTVSAYALSSGDSYVLGFSEGQLKTVRRRLANGQVSYRVNYDDYRDVGGLWLAYEVDAEFPLQATTVKLRLQRPIVNGPAAASLFVLAPGPTTKQVQLDNVSALPRSIGSVSSSQP